jgi:hypothetical protein
MPLDRLALGQDRHGGVIAVQPLGGQNVAFDQSINRLQGYRTGTDLIGQRRQAQIDAFPPVALALPVQGLCWPNFSNKIIASSCGPANPRGVTWNGAGAW